MGNNSMSKLLTEFRQVIEYRELIKNLVLRDLKVRYKRSVLGFLWVMLNPLLIMLVIYTVFSQIFGGFSNYAAYVISGLVLWNMFSQSTSTATLSFLTNANLLKKVSVPKPVFPVSYVLSGLINFCFSLVPLILIILCTGASMSAKVFLLPLCIAEVVVFSMGMALILSTTSVFFHDVIYIYDVLLLAWMYFSAIFYPVDILPGFLLRLIEYNPMYHYLSLFRGLLYDPAAEMAGLGMHLLYGLLFAVISLSSGIAVYASKRRWLIYYL
jgi:ABC-2 type transport system permease protein